jgi:uncharacterized protein YukE
MRQYVSDMTNMWDGEGSQAFLESFNRDRTYFDSLVAVMRNFKQTITTSAELYQDGDRDIASRIRR